MNFRLLIAAFMLLGLTQTAHAILFKGTCSVTYGASSEWSWESDFNAPNSQIVKNTHIFSGLLTVELTVAPGAAAFADVMLVKVQSQKAAPQPAAPQAAFELMSVISSYGYGSVIYSGQFDGQKLALECIVNKVRN